MLAPDHLVVVKLGGSHAFSPNLKIWLAAIANGAGHVVLVPGGGPFADAVRSAQEPMGYDDRTAHRMALLTMEQYGLALAALDDRLVPADNEADIRRALQRRCVPVWMPSRMALGEPDIAESWDVTSDSLAAWLAIRLRARRLVLVKQVDVSGSADVEDLAARGVVDPALVGFVRDAGFETVLLGPGGLGSTSEVFACDSGAQPRRVSCLR